MSVETQFQAQCDNIAAYRSALVGAISGRTHLWGLVDAANDESYENTIKGSTITALDVVMDNASYGSFLGNWFSLHFSYFRDVAGLSGPEYFESALSNYGWRVSQYLNESYYDYYRKYLSTAYVFPTPDLALADYAHTSDVFTAGADTISSTQSGAGIIAAKVTGGSIGASDLDLDLTMTKSTGSSLTVSISVPTGSSVGTVVKVGEQAIGGVTNSGQPVIAVSATAQFVAGEKVLVIEGSAQEVGTISSVTTNTSITLTTNLKHSYTASGKVYPLFIGITGATATAGTDGDTVDFITVPDRTVTL